VTGAVRQARPADAAVVASLASELAQSFTFSRDAFDRTYPALLADENACLLVATEAAGCVGYLLGFRHLTFFANGAVGWVEEVIVDAGHRGRGAGRELMGAFEQWAAARDCALVALATRRAAAFYLAIGYQESASYLRKVLRAQELT
jgi:GNAT superfamily N-acetyltransferase